MGRTPLNEIISEHQSRDLEPSKEEHAQLLFLWERRDACGTKMNFPLLSGGAGLVLSDPEGLWLSEMGIPPVPSPGGSDLWPRGSSFVWEQRKPPTSTEWGFWTVPIHVPFLLSFHLQAKGPALQTPTPCIVWCDGINTFTYTWKPAPIRFFFFFTVSCSLWLSVGNYLGSLFPLHPCLEKTCCKFSGDFCFFSTLTSFFILSW